MHPPRQADNQTLIDVQVNEQAGALVQPEVVCDAGRLASGGRQRELETQTAENVGKIGPRLTVDQQIDVAAPALPALPLPVAFPLAVGDAAARQRRAQAADQRRGCSGAGAGRRRGDGRQQGQWHEPDPESLNVAPGTATKDQS